MPLLSRIGPASCFSIMTAPCWFNTYHIIHCWKINLNLFWFVADSKIKWQQQSFKFGFKFSKKALGHYQQLTLVWVYKIQIFNLIQFVLLDLWPIKDGPCRPLPGGQKLHFYLAAFCKKYILGTFCQIKLKICNLLNFRVLNQNLMVNRDEYIIFSKAWKMIKLLLILFINWKLCYFDISVRFRISENCQKRSITNGIWRMWHSW